MNEQNRRTTDDVRMRGFARRQSVESALAWLDAQLQPLDPEPVALRMAARRVLAESITSTVDVPGSIAQRWMDTRLPREYRRRDIL